MDKETETICIALILYCRDVLAMPAPAKLTDSDLARLAVEYAVECGLEGAEFLDPKDPRLIALAGAVLREIRRTQ